MRDPLVDVDWLASRSSDPLVRIADVRWYLRGKRGALEYAHGHIPGAVFVDLDSDLAAPPGSGPGRHPLPTADAFARTLSRIGVQADSIVVAYDDVGGAIAARLWWLLRHFGHGGGRVLDGGIAAWTSSGRPLVTHVPKLEAASLLTLVGRPDVVDKVIVDRMRRDPSSLVLDARARERYEGQSEPIDARPGHVPGAHAAPFGETLVAPEGPLKPLEELERRYRALGALSAAHVVAYCGSGVTACHTLLTLDALGRHDALLYEGSWSDWAADRDLPAATGPDP